MHEHVAALVGFKRQQLFLFQYAQKIREATQANGALRLTVGTDTTEEEIDQVLEILPPIVADLRRMVSR